VDENTLSTVLASFAAAIAVGYLFGSIPFGLLVSRLAGIDDIRTAGSGNIGATNVLRVGGKGLAAATLLGDMFKGAAAVLVFLAIGRRELAIAAGLGAVLGHVFPVWLGFKGGKGVATYIGVLVALAWPVAAMFGAIWLAVAALTRYSSLAGLIASGATPVLLLWRGNHREAALFGVLTVLLWVMHRGNIVRLMQGTEAKIGKPAPRAPVA
jgi:glycerol-3-phosphate acyltransferase PlsY